MVGDCPFCGRDPYHYVDNGVGMERVAVTCCELGIELFGRSFTVDEITISRDELIDIAGKLSARAEQIEVLEARLATIEHETRESCLQIAERVKSIQKEDEASQFMHELTAQDIINGIRTSSLSSPEGEPGK